MNCWKRKFSNKGYNFWAAFSYPEDLKAWGRQCSLQMPMRVDRGWWLESGDDTILSDINPGLWARETAPAVASVLNYILPQRRWLQCWETVLICTIPCQALGGKVISGPSTSTWKNEKRKDERTCQRPGRTIPLSSWQAMPQLSLSLDPVKYWGKRVVWAFLWFLKGITVKMQIKSQQRQMDLRKDSEPACIQAILRTH